MVDWAGDAAHTGPGCARRAEELARELEDFCRAGSELVLVADRRVLRCLPREVSARVAPGGVTLRIGSLRLAARRWQWRRTTHRFTLLGGRGIVLLRPSRRNEIWLRRQQFRWAVEDRLRRRWRLLRSSLSGGGPLPGLFLQMLLCRRGGRVAALAVDEASGVQAEEALSRLVLFRSGLESRDGRSRPVTGSLLCLPPALAEPAALLAQALAHPPALVTLPDMRPWRGGAPDRVPLLWPPADLQGRGEALVRELGLPPQVRAVVRGAAQCSLEYLGVPFAAHQRGTGVWRFPLQNGERMRDGAAARARVQEQYRMLVRMRRGRVRRHPLFHLYAERWLESLIVRNPALLDAALRPAPVYPQVPVYAARRRVIDLIGVTVQGRLAVIEVKTEKSAALVFQGVAYWQLAWQALREAAFQRNGYFPGVDLQELAPVVYCVTPLLGAHPGLRELAGSLVPRMEIHLVGINSDWRSGIRVLKRERLV